MNTIEPSLAEVELAIGPKYCECHERFKVDQIEMVLFQKRQKLIEDRKAKIKQLHENMEKTKQLHKTFLTQLEDMETELATILINSKNLSDKTSQLSLDFVKLTDRLDSATSMVARADNISTILRYILIFNKYDPIQKPDSNEVKISDECLKELRESKFPLDQIYEASLDISKLLKIIDASDIATESSQKSRVTKAKANLMALRHDYTIDLERIYQKYLQKLYNTRNNQDIISELRNCFSALYALQAGQTAVTKFIENIRFFKSDEGKALHYRSEFNTLTDSELLSHYTTLCTFFQKDCEVNWKIIDKIFDRPHQTKQTLLTTVFNKVFSEFITNVLEHIRVTNEERWCYSLYSLYTQTLKLMDEISALDGAQYSSALLQSLFGKFQTASYSDSNQNQPQSKDQSLSIQGDSSQVIYPDLERKYLEKAMVTFAQQKMDLYAKVQQQQKQLIIKKSEVIIDPFKVFSSDVGINIICAAGEALVRANVLSSPKELPDTIATILNMTIYQTLTNYLQKSVEICASSIKGENDIQKIPKFIDVINGLNIIISTLESTYRYTFKPILLPLTQRNAEFLEAKTKLTTNLGKEIVKGLQNTIDCVCSAAQKLLNSKQKKVDFLQGETVNSKSRDIKELQLKSSATGNLPTLACKEFCALVQNFQQSIFPSLQALDSNDQSNMASFLHILGTKLTEKLKEHFKQFRYTQAGGMQLLLDISEYSRVFKEFQIESLDQEWRYLTEISNLMQVKDEQIQKIKEESNFPQQVSQYADQMIALRTELSKAELPEFIRNFLSEK